MSYELEGKVLKVLEPMSFPSGFAKREFVVEKSGQYPQPIKFTTFKEKMSILDGLEVGQAVKVHFDVRGNENNDRYYVDLNCWKIEQGVTGEASASESSVSSEPAPTQDDDEIPF